MNFMKVRELFETPYDLGDDTNKKFGDSWMSYEATERLYTEICVLPNALHPIKIGQNKENKNIIRGFVDSRKKIDGSSANKCVFFLKFKEQHTLTVIPEELKDAKLLQVDYVETAADIEGIGVAPFTYMALVQDEYTIISDTAQFNGGIGLWKKLARESGFVEMKVNVLDDEHGFTKDASGNLINYTGSNIQKHQIWTSDQNMTGEHTLLVLTSK